MLKVKEYKMLVAIFLALSFNPSFSQSKLSNKAEISLLTCSPGEELYSLFGHSAVRVSDPAQRLDVVFNYGTFSFDEDFYFNFTMGRLNYALSVSEMPNFMRDYQYEGRGIEEQILDLDSAQKQAVFNFLVWNARPENREYLYDFFYDNCSSRIRDVLDSTLSSGNPSFPDLRRESDPSFRNLIDEYLIYHPWGDFGIDLGLGLPCDKVVASAEYMFLPDQLMLGFEGATLDGHPLVKAERTLLPAQGLNYAWSIFQPIPLFWIVAAVLLAFSFLGRRRQKLWRWIDVLYFIMTGAVGALIFFLWFISDHNATDYNFNMLWAWPTHLLFIAFLWLDKVRRTYWLVYGSILILTLLTFPILPQAMHLAVIPLIILGIVRAFINWRYVPANQQPS